MPGLRLHLVGSRKLWGGLTLETGTVSGNVQRNDTILKRHSDTAPLSLAIRPHWDSALESLAGRRKKTCWGLCANQKESLSFLRFHTVLRPYQYCWWVGADCLIMHTLLFYLKMGFWLRGKRCLWGPIREKRNWLMKVVLEYPFSNNSK